jgi:hypothetical protein
MYSGKIAVPPGGGGLRKTKVNNEQPSPSNGRFSLISLVNHSGEIPYSLRALHVILALWL